MIAHLSHLPLSSLDVDTPYTFIADQIALKLSGIGDSVLQTGNFSIRMIGREYSGGEDWTKNKEMPMSALFQEGLRECCAEIDHEGGDARLWVADIRDAANLNTVAEEIDVEMGRYLLFWAYWTHHCGQYCDGFSSQDGLLYFRSRIDRCLQRCRALFRRLSGPENERTSEGDGYQHHGND